MPYICIINDYNFFTYIITCHILHIWLQQSIRHIAFRYTSVAWWFIAGGRYNNKVPNFLRLPNLPEFDISRWPPQHTIPNNWIITALRFFLHGVNSGYFFFLYKEMNIWHCAVNQNIHFSFFIPKWKENIILFKTISGALSGW